MAASAALIFGATAYTSISHVAGAQVRVDLLNKCSSGINIKIDSGGSVTTGRLSSRERSPRTLEVGDKIFVERNLVHTVSNSDNGREIILCK